MENEMANRALEAKATRAKGQRIEAGNREYLKPEYIGSYKITSDELAKLCEGVKITHIVPTKCMYALGARAYKRGNVCSRKLWLVA
jgi:hypothetical protein